MALTTGATALVDMLRRHQVKTLFALPGYQNDALFAALYDARDSIRVVHTRHEQGAAYMALGYAKSTGGVGVYVVVPGPGMLNTTAALATAYANNARVLCITGQIPSKTIGRGYGMLHEIPDSLAILRGLTKWAARIEHPADTERLVNEAFRRLWSGRPRPVALEIPMDVLSIEADIAQPQNVGDLPPKAAPDPDAVAEAARVLSAARRLLIMVGSGAEDAGKEVLAVAEFLQAPVSTYTSGKGIVSDRHYLSQSWPAAHELWADVDAVLAVGTRLQPPQMLWGVDDKLKIVRIDIDREEITRIRPPDVAIVADARLALAALGEQLKKSSHPRESRQDELVQLKEKFAGVFAKVRPQHEFLVALRDELPEDGIFVEELTQVGYAASFAFPVYKPRTYVAPGYQGTLGYGFATALGVKVANPDKAVVAISGDGGFMYNVQELATAVLHKIAIVIVVFVDGAFGNVLRMQKELYGGRRIAVDLRNPDFVRLAEAFGASAERASDPGELRRALRAALARTGPTLIEVPVGEMTRPWDYIHMPRVRPPKTG